MTLSRPSIFVLVAAPILLIVLSGCTRILGERYVIKANADALIFAENRKGGVGARVTYVPGEPKPIDGAGSPLLVELITDVRFDCDGGRIAEEAVSTTFSDGRTLSDTPATLIWESPTPNTVRATILKVGCDEAAARETRTWNSGRTLRRRYAELRPEAAATRAAG